MLWQIKEYVGKCPMCFNEDSLYKDSYEDNVVKCKKCDFRLTDKTNGKMLLDLLENKEKTEEK